MREPSGGSPGSSLKMGILAFVVTALWGLTFVSFSVTLEYFTPPQILLLRTVIAYLSLLAIYPHFHKPESWKTELQLFLAGLCGVTLYVCLTNYALLLTATSNVSVLSSLSPIFTALLMPLFFRGSKIMGRVLIGFLVATVGASIVSTGGVFEFDTNVIGSLLALGSAVAWACYTHILRYLKKSKYSQNYVTRRVFLYGIITTISILLISGDPFDWSALLIPEAFLNLLFLGLVAYTFCHVGWGIVTRNKGSVWASQFTYVTPIATMVGAALILHDQITGIMIVGTVFILLGVMISDGTVVRKIREKITGKSFEEMQPLDPELDEAIKK